MKEHFIPFFKHFKSHHIRFECSHCGKKSRHELIEKKTVIRVLNRSGPKKPGLKHTYVCVLRANEYYLCECCVYKCLNCGRNNRILKNTKRISEEEAKESTLPKLSNLQFLSFVHK